MSIVLSLNISENTIKVFYTYNIEVFAHVMKLTKLLTHHSLGNVMIV